jgi:hypothetical protein
MARIEGISDRKAPFWLKILYWFSRRTAKKLTGTKSGTKSGTMEPLTVMAHRRWIMFADGFFETALQRSNAVDFKLKELARLKASSLAGCPW